MRTEITECGKTYYTADMSSNKFLDELVRVMMSRRSEKELEFFLRAILSPKELKEIPTRLQIVKMLKQGIPQKEIAKKLGVGVATVTRGSKELQKGRFADI